MIKRNFDAWLSKFRANISEYRYYIDFDKVVRNVEDIEIELNILNSLIGPVNIEDNFERIIIKYPETLSCIPLLLIVWSDKVYIQDENDAFRYSFKTMSYNTDQYKIFIGKTGLFDLLQKHLVDNLIDYALGIETRPDSSDRKNWDGYQMEDLVEQYITATRFMKDENYFEEMYLKDTGNKWDIDLPALSSEDRTAKRLDLVVRTKSMIYTVETSFYSSGSSKLNETARSYKMLPQEVDTIGGFSFVWFIDGIDWKNIGGGLQKAFEVMECVHSTDDIEHSVMTALLV